MTLTFDFATDTDTDIAALTALHSAVAGHLTREYGDGPWSSSASETSVRRGVTTSKVIVARDADGIAGTLRLTPRKPLSIDRTCFTRVDRPLYLVDMAVRPSIQRSGVGRSLLSEAVRVAIAWPAQALRLDAYDAAAGAGGFYATCGFREAGRAAYRKVPLIYYERLLDAPGGPKT
ncbi:MAG TPA: GNAT family N-acetyltransferase [Vicinamibacterales bacterium]|nr:GNAT family N-acetyltransferase [Vicinamibacterales bacterium]